MVTIISRAAASGTAQGFCVGDRIRHPVNVAIASYLSHRESSLDCCRNNIPAMVIRRRHRKCDAGQSKAGFNQKLRPQPYRPSNEHLNGKEAELISFVLRLPFAIDGNRSQRKGQSFAGFLCACPKKEARMRCARRVIWTGLFSRISGKVYLSRPLYYRVFTSFRPLRS